MSGNIEDKNFPIGVFDSGVGGLTVLRELNKALPHEHLIYFGDLGRSPYGTKSPATVRRYVRQITRHLLSRKVKLIVIACNTASAAAGDDVKALAAPVPVMEVVGHSARAAIEAVLPQGDEPVRIGVLATATTVASDIYKDRLLELSDHHLSAPPLIMQKACPLFVPLAEEGLWEGPITDLAAEMYLAKMREFDPHAVILGCTHYPLLRKAIEKALPPGTVLGNGAESLALAARDLLSEQGLLAESELPGRLEFIVSDSEDTFRRQAERFLDMPVDIVHHIDLDACEGREE